MSIFSRNHSRHDTIPQLDLSTLGTDELYMVSRTMLFSNEGLQDSALDGGYGELDRRVVELTKLSLDSARAEALPKEEWLLTPSETATVAETLHQTAADPHNPDAPAVAEILKIHHIDAPEPDHAPSRFNLFPSHGILNAAIGVFGGRNAHDPNNSATKLDVQVTQVSVRMDNLFAGDEEYPAVKAEKERRAAEMQQRLDEIAEKTIPIPRVTTSDKKD